MAQGDATIWSFYQGENRTSLLPSHPRHDRLFKLIVDKAKKDSVIVDVGFGDGYLLKRLSEKFTDIHGVDISESNIEVTKKDVPQAIFHLSGNNKLPFNDSSVDVLITSEVLEHMTDLELEETRMEAFRVLKRGGLWISTVPAREILQENACVCPSCGHEFHRWGHKRSWSSEGFSNYFKKTFSSVQVYEEVYAPSTWYLLNTIEFIVKKVLLSLRRKVKDSKFLALVTKHEA